MRLSLVLASATLLLVLTITPGKTQQVIGLSGDQVTISVGSRDGVAVGMAGKVCDTETVGNQKVEVCPAAFRVIEVHEHSAVAEITRSRGAVRVGMRAEFDKKLKPPEHASRRQAAIKHPEKARPLSADKLLSQANRLYDAKNWESAGKRYLEFAERFPQSSNAGYASKLASVCEKRVLAAQQAKKAAAKRAAERKAAQELVGQAQRLLDAGQWKDALERAQKALEADASNTEAQPIETRAQAHLSQASAVAQERTEPGPTAASAGAQNHGALRWLHLGGSHMGRADAVASVASQPGTYYFGSLSGEVWKTTNGGKAWSRLLLRGSSRGPIGAIAVSPSSPNVVYVGIGEMSSQSGTTQGDGVWKSVDAGKTWAHIGPHNRFISRILIDPKNPDQVYVVTKGHLIGPNQEPGIFRSADGGRSWERILSKYHFQQNPPIFFSPNYPDTLYAAVNILLKSTDDGGSWTIISPDLTRGYYKGKQHTILTALEDPAQPGVLWVGSDGGIVQLTRDGGRSWENETPSIKLLPNWSQISSFEANPFVQGSLYLVATRNKLDDLHPYLYRTDDWGHSWTEITNGIPDHAFVHVIRADPVRRGLLFAGTENGIYITLDDGAHWKPFQLNLPAAPVTNLTIENGDLVAATRGRGFWVLDHLSTLRQLSPAMATRIIH